MPKPFNGIRFILSIGVCQLAGIAGALFTTPAIPIWYAALEKPFFTPPSWVFGPAWGLLYLLMGISLYLVWQERGSKQKKVIPALKVFGLQLGLNLLWSISFFGLRSPALGFVVILLLGWAIWKTIRAFKPISARAAYLLYPYLLWVGFAALLNLAILFLNPVF
ncbi:MAG: TspO/MBR family protein [Candidatus Diapherotrites archaeon]|nr:TspO/MBR family protein [Candidatus Diapherotrites archaeon]MDZ4256121.1 TspO/MBR family protein [archaeon]